MSNLVQYAEEELRRAGLFDKNSDYGGLIGKAVLDLVQVFAKAGHSGASACIALSAFNRVASFRPLTPLTGEDSEWIEVADGVFQNRRASNVFKENGQAYDINGRIFREPDGATFTSKASRVAVVFPYAPRSEVVDVESGP